MTFRLINGVQVAEFEDVKEENYQIQIDKGNLCIDSWNTSIELNRQMVLELLPILNSFVTNGAIRVREAQ